jgi:hypothetical protein
MIMKREVAQGRWQEGPGDWIGELAFSQPPGQVMLSVKGALQFSGPVSVAPRESQQDAWRGLWVELQLGTVSEQPYSVRRGSTSGFR